MKRSELRQIIQEEVQRLKEAKITTIPNFNLESDVAIALLKLLKNNSKFKKIAIDFGVGFLDGNINKTKATIQSIKKIINKDVIAKLSLIIKDRTFQEVISVNSSDKVIELLSSILTYALVFEFDENPIGFSKSLGNADLIKTAAEFSVNRGKSKMGTMLNNKGF